MWRTKRLPVGPIQPGFQPPTTGRQHRRYHRAVYEGNRCAWGSLMNSVVDGFESCKASGRQAHAGSDDHTIVVRRTQLTLHGRLSGFIRPDQTDVGLPSAFGELLHRNRDAGVDLLGGHTWWQSRVRKIHSLWTVAQQQNPHHELSLILARTWRHPLNGITALGLAHWDTLCARNALLTDKKTVKASSTT